MKDTAFWFIGALLYLSILYALVRPNSRGPELISNILNSLSDLIRGSAGYSYDNSTGKWTAPSK